jgi:hypothetical protein
MTENDLRWRLRQLPRQIEPSRDLWPAIQAGIQRPVARSPRRLLTSLAMAASLILAAGLFWNAPAPTAPVADVDITAKVVTSEARAMTDEYQAALRQFDGAPIARQMGPSLGELDHSVEQIQKAISADPQSLFLLEQLRKTYSLRLALTQRAIVS